MIDDWLTGDWSSSVAATSTTSTTNTTYNGSSQLSSTVIVGLSLALEEFTDQTNLLLWIPWCHRETKLTPHHHHPLPEGTGKVSLYHEDTQQSTAEQ